MRHTCLFVVVSLLLSACGGGGGGVGVGGGGGGTPPVASTLLSDDFNRCGGLGAGWMQVDPVGDAMFDIDGLDTSDPHARLTSAGAATHPLRGDMMNASRLMTTANDTDFELERIGD